MAITEERIQQIEKNISDILERIETLVPKLQFNQAYLAYDSELQNIKKRLDSIESQIQLLQSD